MDYRVDLRDLKFQLFEWLPTEKLLEADRFVDWDRDSVEMVIQEALKLAQEEFAPINEDGDRTGVRLEDGRVTTPESFKPAYKALREGGWVGCINNPELGGMGLPQVIGSVVNELFAGANLSLCLNTLLIRGASHLIELYGTDEMRGLFCEKMYTGEWGGTMCLTEAQAGSDVGASRAKAVQQDNGRYLISGEKIFITFGEHDLTENIIHAVLARTPDAPEGTRGLSLFIVPKIRVGEDGSLGEANDVICANIEHKLGIHGSPTCSLLFGQNGACEGYLLGSEGDGMRLMFQMMNEARIEVGLQGMAVAAAAHQAALAYAKERLQMRHWSRMGDKDAPQVAIVEHPDVRRMLLSSAAYVQAMRALLLQTSYYNDMTQISEGEERQRYQAYVDLLTPVCKAWASDWGFRVTEWCLQIYGGYGYTKDYPAEQYLRDNKIASIYEGTNGIQALDFVTRKLPSNGGKTVREILGRVKANCEKLSHDKQLGEPAKLLGAALKQLDDTAREVGRRSDAVLITLLNAVPLQEMFGTTLGGHFLLEQAAIAKEKLGTILEQAGASREDAKAYSQLLEFNSEAAFYHNKIQAALHFAYRALPGVTAQAMAVRAGETAPMDAVM